MRIVLELAYCGTAYHGWQIQPNADTVQARVNAALSATFEEDVTTAGSSRTDAGVHAKSFFCHFDTDKPFPLERLPLALNSRLPPDIAVLSARRAEDGFHCRFSAKRKTYEYLIWNAPTRNVLLYGRAWHYPFALDTALMDRAAKDLLGEHDFAAFMAEGGTVGNTVRTICDARVGREGDLVTFTVTGNGFLYNMVRIIVGTLVYVSRGKLPPDGIPSLIAARDRTKTGPTVPPDGLYLVKTEYTDGF